MDNTRVLKIDTGQAQKSVKDLRNELKELRSTMLSTEKGTEEYNKALQQAAEIQHTLKEQMEEVNASAMDFGQIASNCTKAVGGLVAGFQAANAVMNLFGVENEDVIKSLQKMQSLMALTQAFPAIDSSIKAFQRLALVIKSSTTALQGFSKAAIATGLGAIVVALGLLIANWDKLTNAVNTFIGNNPRLTKALDDINTKIKEGKDELDKLAKSYEDWATKQKEGKLNSEAKKQYDDLANSIVGATLKLNELKQAERVAEEEMHKAAVQRITGDAWRKVKEALQTATNNRKEAEANLKLLEEQKQAILDNADSYKELGDSADKALDKIKATEKELAIILWDATQKIKPQSLQEELEAKFRDNPITIPVKIEIDEEEELSVDDEAFLAKADELRKNVESVINGLRNAFITPEEQYAQEQHALELALNSRLISEQEYYKLSEALAKEHVDNQKALAVAEAQVWMSALGNIGTIFSSMSDMIDRSTEEGEEKYKALMYTSTVISMLAGIGGAIASAFMPVNAGMTIWGQIAMAATTSASVLAAGISQLVQIKNANQNSSLGGASGIASTPNTNAVSSIIAPVQYTQDVQGANIEGAIRDSKVYVTETDITDTQNRVKVTETEARY